MNARDALIEYLVDQQVIGPDDDPAAWFDDPWYRVPIGKHRIPILPLFGLRPSLTLHDLNHLISGYDLSPRGEVQSAAWELGSGGCGRHVFWWVDRSFLFLMGLVLMPRVTLGALRAGTKQRNLYSMQTATALASDVEELRRWAKR